MNEADAKKTAKAINSIPDKEFRAKMDEKDGILLIYLIDSRRIFEPIEGVFDQSLQEYSALKNLNLDIHLVGLSLIHI